MYVFGGLAEIKKCCNELFRFHLEEKNWEELQVEGSPSPRCGALMLNVEGFLLILGGKNQQEEALNEVYVLDIDGFYQKFKENAQCYGVIYNFSEAEIVPPAIPKEFLKAKRYVRKTDFNPESFI